MTGALHCRFAVLAGKMEQARNLDTNVDRVSSYRVSLESPLSDVIDRFILRCHSARHRVQSQV